MYKEFWQCLMFYMDLKEFGQCLGFAENAFEADKNEAVSRAHVGILWIVVERGGGVKREPGKGVKSFT
jgi:hypothetical protein